MRIADKPTRSPNYRVRDTIILVLITVLAAYTRLTYLDFVEFKSDESRVAGIAIAFLEGRMLPLTGISSSVGISNPPAFVYLMSIPIAISRSPAFATGFIGLLGVFAALLCYRFCDEFFDRRTAQVAALLFAVAPWEVIFSRKMQAQDVVPFFILLFMGAAYKLTAGRGSIHILGIALWLSFLIELHYGAVALIPFTIVVLVLNWRRLAWRWVLGAVGLTILLWLPFLIFQLTHNFTDLHALLKLMHRTPHVDLQGFQWVIDMVGVNAFNGWTGVTFPRYVAVTPTFDTLYSMEKYLFLAGVVYVLGHLARTRGEAKGDWRYVLLVLWLIIPPLFFVRHNEPLYPHYFLTVFPAQFIFIGLLYSDTERWVRRRVAEQPTKMSVAVASGVVGYGLVGAIVASQVYGYAAVMHWVTSVTAAGSFGVPLRQREQAIDSAVALSAGTKKPVYVASSGQDYPAAFEYLAYERVSLKVFDDRNTFVAPADDGKPTIYLTSDPRQPVSKFLQQRFVSDLVKVIAWPGQQTGFDLYRLPSNAGAQLLDETKLRPINRTMDGDMRLIGYSVDTTTAKAGEPLHLQVYWQILNVPAKPIEISFFSHLIDTNGHVWAQDDGLGYPERFWRKGDMVVSWFTLPAESTMGAGEGWIEFGVYRRRGIVRQPLRADNGSSVDRLLLGPIKLVPSHVPTVPTPQHQQVALFGSEISLLGYDLPATATPGSTLHVALTWEDRVVPAADYTAFAHVLDASGHIVAQADDQPGPYPTTLWSPGEKFRDEHAIALPATLPPGTYHLEVGLYRRDTMARLPVGKSNRVILSTPLTVVAR